MNAEPAVRTVLQHGGEAGEQLPFGVSHNVALRTQIDEVRSTLQQCQCDRGVTGDGCDFLSALFTLFGKLFQRRDRNSEELDDNRAVDIRGDGHGENRTIVERVTGHHAQIVHKRFTGGIDDTRAGNVGERNRNRCTDSEDEYDQCGEKHLFTKICNFPGINKRTYHFRSPRPSRRRLRSSVLRIR